MPAGRLLQNGENGPFFTVFSRFCRLFCLALARARPVSIAAIG